MSAFQGATGFFSHPFSGVDLVQCCHIRWDGMKPPTHMQTNIYRHICLLFVVLVGMEKFVSAVVYCTFFLSTVPLHLLPWQTAT